MALENCTFVDNNVTRCATYGVNSVLNITNCTFGNNTGIQTGTICMLEHSNLTVNGATFKQNIIAGSYGVITDSSYGTIYIQNTIFALNTKPKEKYSETGTIRCGSFCFLHINNCTFSGNIVGMGGGVYAERNSTVVIGNSIFTNNVAEWGGGVFVYANSMLKISTSIFDNNTAWNGYGGAVLTQSRSHLICESSTFINNKASDLNGGAIALSLYSSASLSALTLTKNYAVEGGGALYSIVSTIVEIYSCTFNDNSGGALSVSNTYNVTVKNSQFFGNKAIDGGAIWFYDSDRLILSDVKFIQNTARVHGGAIYCTSAIVYINNCLFKDNTATYDGGVVHSTSNNVHIRNSYFENNSAKDGSGGVLNIIRGKLFVSNSSAKYSYAAKGGAIQGSESDIELMDCIFENNTADLNGGAMFITGSLLTAEKVTYLDNTASVSADGGAIYAEGCTIYVLNSLFAGNRAPKGSAGAISLKSDVLYVKNTTFLHNYAQFVGAIAVRGLRKMELIDSNFIENSVKIPFTTIDVQSSPLVAINTVFNQNLGVFYIYGSVASFEHCTFNRNGNNATIGGTMSTENCRLRLSTTIFDNNLGYGGQDMDFDPGVEMLTYLTLFKHSQTLKSNDKNFKQKGFEENLFCCDPADVTINESQYASGKISFQFRPSTVNNITVTLFSKELFHWVIEL